MLVCYCTVTATFAECETEPLVAVTVTTYVPAGVPGFPETVYAPEATALLLKPVAVAIALIVVAEVICTLLQTEEVDGEGVVPSVVQ